MNRCLDENELAELYDGILPLDSVHDHLASCPSCRRKLALLISASDNVTSLSDKLSPDSITQLKKIIFPGPHPRIIPAYSAIAAVILIFVFIYLYMDKEITREPPLDLPVTKSETDIGYLVDLDGNISIDSQLVTASTPIKADSRIQTHKDSQCKIHFANGTELALKDDTSIRLGLNTWELMKGDVWAYIVPEQIPLTIKTANGKIEIIGTEITVSADNDETNVEVIKGEVRCVSGNEERKVSERHKTTLRKNIPPKIILLKRVVARHKFSRLVHTVLPRHKRFNRLVGTRFIDSDASDWRLSFERGLSIGTDKRNAQAQVFLKSLISLDRPLNLSFRLSLPKDPRWATHFVFFQPGGKHLALVFRGEGFLIVSKIGPAPPKILHRQRLSSFNSELSIELSKSFLIVQLDDQEVFSNRHKLAGFERVIFGVWIRNHSKQYNETRIESFSITKGDAIY